MLGKVDGETMMIMDSFALPVEGTETRVNAQAAAYEYMAAYIENAKQVEQLNSSLHTFSSASSSSSHNISLCRTHRLFKQIQVSLVKYM